MTWRRAILLLPPALLGTAPAMAQVGEDLTVQARVPQDYSRGRNVAVEERPRPDYDPLGLRFGGIQVFPRLEAGVGGTTNTYLVNTNDVASAFVYATPSVRVASDWSRHQLIVAGSATRRDYIGQSRRNERLWNLDTQFRLDVRRDLALQARVSSARRVESLFSGEVGATIAALSRYRSDLASLQATYTSGRTRAFVLADHLDLRFSAIPLSNGGVIDQSGRDRAISRLTGQIEFARTPSVSLFAQLSGGVTNFDRNLLGSAPNLDSKAVRLLAGTNIDIAGRFRGTIGLGYGVRDYSASIYPTVRGLSVDSTVQLFPSRLLTITVTGERTIEDSTLTARSAVWNTRFTLRSDFELRRNLILNQTADYSHQSYIGSSLSGDTYRAGIGARYLGSRRVRLEGGLSYSIRSSNNAQLLGGVNEGRIQAGIAYQL